MSKTAFTDHFSKVSSHYASHRPVYPVQLFEWLAGISDNRQLVWDCATGTGQAALALADYFENVWATDASSSQIEAASRADRIKYSTAPAHCSGLADQSVDLVTVAQALHWFELENFYSEVRRVLKPDGLIAVWTYGVFRVAGENAEEIQLLLDNFYHGTVGSCWPAERRHVENGYADLDFPFTEIHPPDLEMAVDWNLANLAGYLRSWSATSRYIEINGIDPVAKLTIELEPLWGNGYRRVIWPLSIRAGRMETAVEW